MSGTKSTSKYTDITQREKILQLHDEGYTQKEIARLLFISPATVNLWINRRGDLTTKTKTGRRRKTTVDQDDAIYSLSVKDPFLPATDINRKLELNISHQTVRNRMVEKGLKNCKPSTKPFLSQVHKTKRLEFAHTYIHWTPEKWENVFVADEKVFQSFGNGSQRVWRPKLNRWDKSDDDDDDNKITRFHESVLNYHKTSKRFSIPIWGCIGLKNHIHLIKISHLEHKYFIREILNVYLKHDTDKAYLLHDKSPIHTAKAVKEWYKNNNITVLEWPPYSPDLNPIENLWGKMEYMTRNRNPTSREHLWNIVYDTYQEIITNDEDYIKNLVRSMPKRLEDVIKAEGNFTKY